MPHNLSILPFDWGCLYLHRVGLILFPFRNASNACVTSNILARSFCLAPPFAYRLRLHSSLFLFFSFTIHSGRTPERKFLWEKTMPLLGEGRRRNPLASARAVPGSAE